MAIRTDDGELVATCDFNDDECDCTVYGGTLEFRSFIADLSDQGWTRENKNGEWLNFCPEHSAGELEFTN